MKRLALSVCYLAVAAGTLLNQPEVPDVMNVQLEESLSAEEFLQLES